MRKEVWACSTISFYFCSLSFVPHLYTNGKLFLLQVENISEPQPLLQQGQSSESITNNICISPNPDQGHGNSDTSLKLGYVVWFICVKTINSYLCRCNFYIWYDMIWYMKLREIIYDIYETYDMFGDIWYVWLLENKKERINTLREIIPHMKLMYS